MSDIKITATADSQPEQNSKGLYALMCLLVVGSLLALSLVIGKLADDGGAPRLAFLMLAMAGAGIILLPLAILQSAPMHLNRRVLEYAAVSGLLLALPNALGFLAVRHVGAGFISLCFAFPILITWILSVVMRLETVYVLRLIGVVLGLAGGVLLASGNFSASGETGGWTLLVLTMPVILSLGNIYRTLRWPDHASPVYLAALMMFGGALCLLPFVLLTEPGHLSTLFDSSYLVTLLMLEVAVFSVLYFCFFILQKIAGPVYLSQIGTVAAISGIALGVFFLGESAPQNLVISGTLVMLGLLLFHKGARHQSSVA